MSIRVQAASSRRGATRLALFVLSLLAVSWILNEHHVGTFWEVGLFIMFVGKAFFSVAFLWMLYIALEPFVRRRWPHILVSWTRLLSGEWRDPLVGRDVLIGCAGGLALACCSGLRVLAPSWFGYPEETPLGSAWAPLLGAGSFVSQLLDTLGIELLLPLAILFLLVFLRILLRRNWLAIGAWVLIISLPNIFESEIRWIAAPIALIANAIFLFLLMRVGLVAVVLTAFVVDVVNLFPITFQTSAWYAGIGYAALLVVAAITLYGFRTSLGGRPLLGTVGVGD